MDKRIKAWLIIIDKVMDKRIKALKETERDKARVAYTYNKKVKGKSFQIGGSSFEDRSTTWNEEQ